MIDIPDEPIPQDLLDMAQAMLHGVPFAKALGLELVSLRRARAAVKIVQRPEFVGNPETGVVHGGVITSMLDNVAGIAVFSAMREIASTATLDLRIDYTRAADPGRDIHASAECYKVTRSIAFARGAAYHDDPDDPIATCVGAFMIGSGGNMRPGSKEAAERVAGASREGEDGDGH